MFNEQKITNQKLKAAAEVFEEEKATIRVTRIQP